MTDEDARDPQSEELTSSKLLRQVQARDQQAWADLVRLYGPLVYHWCRQSQLRPEDSADVTQDVFRGVARNINEFHRHREGDTFRGWLWTVTRNKVCDFVRRIRERPQSAGGSSAQQRLNEIPDPHGDTPPPSFNKHSQNLYAVLEELQGQVERRTWQAFWRTTIDGHDAEDVSRDLKMTKLAVYKAKSRMLHRLRHRLADTDDTPENGSI